MAESGDQKRVQEIAYRVYLNRRLRGRSGDARTDWQTAETIAQKPLKRLLFWSNCGLLSTSKLGYRSAKFAAWDIPKWGIFSLPKLEWVKLLAVPLVVAAAGSIITRNFQREAEQNRILKEYFARLETFTFERELLTQPLDSGVVILARGRTVTALRELDRSRREQRLAFLRASDLATIEASKPADESAQRPDTAAQNSEETEVTVGKTAQDPDESDENTETTDENSDTVQEPVISFRDQDLSEMDLRNINLSNLDFRSTNFRDADLQDADLGNANLEAAFLGDSNLQGTDFRGANLQNLSLQDILKNGNVRAATSPTELEALLAEAILCRTILPDYIELDGNRDCDTP